MSTFYEKLRAKWAQGKFVCVGLDSDATRMPERVDGLIKQTEKLRAFNEDIVQATKEYVCAYKLDSAFFEALGSVGVGILMDVIDYIRSVAPDVAVIVDANRTGVQATNTQYAKAVFDHYRAHAVTVNPYFGEDGLRPFLDRDDKGIIVLCRTSHPGAAEFQMRDIPISSDEYRAVWGRHNPLQTACGYAVGMPLYQYVAHRVAHVWNKSQNCALVVGATDPEELRLIRQIAGDIPLLIPGIGRQGGDLRKTVEYGMDSRGEGMIINSSSAIIFASSGPDFAEAAGRETIKLHNQITQYREQVLEGRMGKVGAV